MSTLVARSKKKRNKTTGFALRGLPMRDPQKCRGDLWDDGEDEDLGG